MVTRALVALALLILGGRGARAEVVDLPGTLATITLDEAWTKVPAATLTPALVAGYRASLGSLAITRAAVPNPDAYRAKTRDAYLAEIERGVATTLAGYKRTSRKLGEVNGVPVLDLEARRTGDAVTVIRVLVFRTYALSLAIEVQPAELRAARAIASTFQPPKPTP